jgi:nucleoid-associated protein YgaU
MALAIHTQPIRSSSRVRPQAGRQRVYARRRAAVAVVLGLALGGGLFARGAVAERSHAGGIEMPRSIVAVQGDTLWAIAHRLAPQGNVMDLVDRLVELNGANITAGQVIRIP